MKQGLVAIAAVLALVTGACVGAPTSTTGGTAAPSPLRTPHPTATDIEPGGTAVPQEVFGPDEFWARTGGTDMTATYDSEDSILRGADLVVAGTLDRFDKGPVIKVSSDGTLAYFHLLTLSATTVVRGTPVSPAAAPGTVTVIAFHGFAWDEPRFKAFAASAPIGQRVVLFLSNSVAEAKRSGQDPKSAGVGPEVYVMLNGSQAWIRDDGGVARVYAGPAAPTWTTTLAGGRSFDDVVKGLVEEAARLD